MSPYPGEMPLSLWFGVFFAVLGALIVVYLLWKMIPQFRRRMQIKRERLDPQGLTEHPEAQSRVDQLFLLRRTIRETLHQKGYSQREQDMYSRRMGVAISHGVRFAYDMAAGDKQAKTSLDRLEASFERIKGRVLGELKMESDELNDLLEEYQDVVLS